MNPTSTAYRNRHRWIALLISLTLLISLLTYSLSATADLTLPTATGEVVFIEGDLVVDASNTSQGYLMAKHEPNDKPLKLRLTCGKSSLTYDFAADGKYEIFPLSFGSGNYKIEVFQQASGKKYKPLLSTSVQADVAHETLPYLVPNQYVDYDEDSDAVLKSIELCHGLESDWDKYQIIYRYMANHMIYDFEKARTVSTGYLPVVDDVLAAQKGICFDLSALMAAMLRVQGIPTQLVIGYADRIYHAWNLVYLDDTWYRCDITSDIMCMDVSRYTTERYY